jgi:trigger factor
LKQLKVDYSEESAVKKALHFEIEPEVVGAEISSRAREYARRVKLPGFRPGKVPTRVILQRFRKEILDDVAEKVVNKVVFDELDGRGLKPVATPRVEDLEITEVGPMRFKAVFEVLPLIEVPDWRGLKATAPAVEVKDEDVDRELAQLREAGARYEPIEGRAAEKGDFAVVDVTRTPKGGGEPQRNENALLEIGGEDQPAELNQALLGLEIGATAVAEVKPEAAEGEEPPPGASYSLTLKELKRKVLPELDDELARDVGEFETLAALTDEIRSRLRAAAEREADRAVKRELVDALVAKTSFELPQALVEHHMSARTESAVRGLASQGVDPRQLGIDWREFREKQRQDAEKAARADLLLDEIARREGVEATDAEVDTELSRLAPRVKKSKEALRAQMEKDGDLAALRARIREEKVLDLIKAGATVVSG